MNDIRLAGCSRIFEWESILLAKYGERSDSRILFYKASRSRVNWLVDILSIYISDDLYHRFSA
jgi:hypothetical protein